MWAIKEASNRALSIPLPAWQTRPPRKRRRQKKVGAMTTGQAFALREADAAMDERLRRAAANLERLRRGQRNV